MQQIEFTIEPFVDGAPGPHVTAPQDALRSRGFSIDIGPFGTSVVVADDEVGVVTSVITSAAIDHGATHIHLDVASMQDMQ